MKIKSLLIALLALLTINSQLSTLHAQGTAFTYQGRLNDGANPANGRYDFRFKLYADSLGNTPAGSSYLTNAIPATNGLFTVAIDFGAGIFTGSNYWLEVDVKTNNAGSYTVLSPLQGVMPMPYAIFANTAGNVTGAVPAAQLSGTIANGALPASPNFSGTVAASAFSGGGASLTSLNANNLSSGTIPLAQLPGAVVTNNATSVNLTGTFTGNLNGNGGGLTSLQATQLSGTVPLAQLPGAVVTNNQSSVSLTGTFNGNGGGLTNVIAATLAIPNGMALIPAGTFSMGDSLDGESDATPTTNITVSAIYMDVKPVSYSQWKSVYYWATNQGGYGFVNAGAGKAANNPVQTVDWFDCVKWCNARSQQAGRTPVYYTDAGYTHIYTNLESYTVYVNPAANGFRLPTEAEWEKAARGGLSGQRFPWGNNIDESLANYNGFTAIYSYDFGPNGYNAVGIVGGTSPATSPVGSFAPNGYGLYDMAGNVYEWCWDWYGTPYGQPTNTNPNGPTIGSLRVLRGGQWSSGAIRLRCAYRTNDLNPNYADDTIGFRCVMGL